MAACRFSPVALIALALAGLIVPAPVPSASAAYGNKAQANQPPAPLPPMVIRFAEGKRARYFGHDVLVVSGVGAMDGNPVQIAVPNVDARSGKFEPQPRVMDEIKALKPGDYVRVETTVKDKQVWMRKVEPYKVTPGEEQPGTFVFNESYTQAVGGQDHLYVRLTKFANIVDCVIPMKRNESKQSVPDPAVSEQLGKFKKGDVVEAEVQPGRPFATLRGIEAYAAPVPAKMGKVVETEIDGQKYPAVELDEGGKSLSLPVNGRLSGKKRVPDARLLSSAKALKPGAEVLIRTREDGGKTWLKEIRPAPRQPTAKGK